jgi:hypothetical protein
LNYWGPHVAVRVSEIQNTLNPLWVCPFFVVTLVILELEKSLLRWSARLCHVGQAGSPCRRVPIVKHVAEGGFYMPTANPQAPLSPNAIANNKEAKNTQNLRVSFAFLLLSGQPGCVAVFVEPRPV